MKTINYRAAAGLRRLLTKAPAAPADRDTDKLDELARRVEHLEAVLEGLQDAVYRQDVVHDRQIADLRKRDPTRADERSPGLQDERP